MNGYGGLPCKQTSRSAPRAPLQDICLLYACQPPNYCSIHYICSSRSPAARVVVSPVLVAARATQSRTSLFKMAYFMSYFMSYFHVLLRAKVGHGRK